MGVLAEKYNEFVKFTLSKADGHNRYQIIAKVSKISPRREVKLAPKIEAYEEAFMKAFEANLGEDHPIITFRRSIGEKECEYDLTAGNDDSTFGDAAKEAFQEAFRTTIFDKNQIHVK